ncbi:hypothetical protein FQN57_000963 [Myotisia sp. PD_48]|nr:hypothetical protein FQN57_000963 [Myotisia sp. PD_48]
MPPRSRKLRQLERRGVIPTGGLATDDKPEDVFHFVTVNPTSEDQKTENRSLIRSHASKYIWRQHRAVRGDSSVIARESSNGTESGRISTRRRGSAATSKPRGTQDGRDEGQASGKTSSSEFIGPSILEASVADAVKAGDTSESEGSPPPTGCNAIAPYVSVPHPARRTSEQNTVSRPFNQLISWLEDPAHICPSMLEESAMSKLMRYAAFDLWPGLVLGADGKRWGREAAAENWLPRAMGNPALFTAFLYGAAGHMQTRKRLESAQMVQQTREEKLEQIVCETETIKQLNKMMKDPSQVCSDEVILAVLCMAFNRIDYSGWTLADPSPKAPLRNLQWLDVYGGLSLNDHHVKGLMALIQTKGGLDKMKMPGLAETLSTSAIMLSTKYLVRPKLPFVPIFKDTALGRTPDWPSPRDDPTLAAILSIKETVGNPKPLEDPISHAWLPENLADILRNMREYNEVVELHTQGLLPSLELAVIADRRNWIQFNLVSLPPSYEFSEAHLDAHRTYESCRLAAMVYSMLVIFPLPAANRPFQRMTPLIKTAVQSWPDPVGSMTPTEGPGPAWHLPADRKAASVTYGMYLWVLMMGAIASRATTEPDWFPDRLREAVNFIGLSTWEELKEILSLVMWMDSVCDYCGQAIWFQAMRV